MPRHWKKEEELAILQGIGANSCKWLCRKGGNRSISALYHKLDRLGYNGGLTRGSYTLAQLIELTGYSRWQLKRAMNMCGQKWRRTSTKGSFVITEDQVEEICAWLGKDFWSKKHRLYRCLWCNTQDIDHAKIGLCINCYNEYRRLLRLFGLRKYNIKEINYWIVLKYFTLKDIHISDKFTKKGRALPRELLLKYVFLKEQKDETKISFKKCPIPYYEG